MLHISIDKPGFYLLPFQIASLARRVSVTLHIFISQIAPPDVDRGSSASKTEGLSPRTVRERIGKSLRIFAMSRELFELTSSHFLPSSGWAEQGLFGRNGGEL